MTISPDFGAADDERLDASIHSLKGDCKPFNPKDRAELVNPQDDSPKSIGIRVFMGIVKETDYQLTLGINVFTATV